LTPFLSDRSCLFSSSFVWRDALKLVLAWAERLERVADQPEKKRKRVRKNRIEKTI